MSDKKLETFKVGERNKKAQVKHTPSGLAEKSGKTGAIEVPTATVGFARIEALLDQETPKNVHKRLDALVHSLDSLAEQQKAQKERANIKRAHLAVTRTKELVDYLYATKASMMDAFTQQMQAHKGQKSSGGNKKTTARKSAPNK